MKKITVVVPFYNRASFFKRLIKSVEAQNVNVFSLLIVDNGSSLREIEIIWPIILNSNLNVTLVSTLQKGNANFARNLGYELAVNGFVAFIDSDDWWESCHLLESVKLLNKSSLTGVYSGAQIFGNGSYLNKSIDVNKLKSPYDLLFSKKGYIAQTSSYVLKKDFRPNVVSWDESLKRHQDFDFFLNHYYFGGGWEYSEKITVNVDWDRGGTKNVDTQSKLLFFNKWEKKFPLSLSKHYLYTQVCYCLKVGEVKYKGEFKRLYLSKFGTLFDKLILTDSFMYFRLFCVFFLEKSNLKYRVRSLVRRFF